MADKPLGHAPHAAFVTPDGPWLPVEHLARVGSTNDVVREAPRPGRVVVADVQTAGRGRSGRVWTTTPGTSLAVSVLAPVPASGAGWVPLFVGLAVHAAVAQVAGVRTALKWPNDVLVPDDGHRKLAGILCEWTPAGVVAGMGLNVGLERADLPLETATSLRALGSTVERAAVLEAYLRHLGRVLAEDTGPYGASAEAYRAVCSTVGRDVEIHLPGGTRRGGRATGIDAEGRLTLSTDAGIAQVTAGDVVHVRPH